MSERPIPPDDLGGALQEFGAGAVIASAAGVIPLPSAALAVVAVLPDEVLESLFATVSQLGFEEFIRQRKARAAWQVITDPRPLARLEVVFDEPAKGFVRVVFDVQQARPVLEHAARGGLLVLIDERRQNELVGAVDMLENGIPATEEPSDALAAALRQL